MGEASANIKKEGTTNGRIEVPALTDDEIVVVNSSDIVGHLEFRYPAKPVYPESCAARVHAQGWERAADTFIDPILVDISYWKWADRLDQMPEGLLESARADLRLAYDALDSELTNREFVSGPFSIADIALFPHLANAGNGGQVLRAIAIGSRSWGPMRMEPTKVNAGSHPGAPVCHSGAMICQHQS